LVLTCAACWFSRRPPSGTRLTPKCKAGRLQPLWPVACGLWPGLSCGLPVEEDASIGLDSPAADRVVVVIRAGPARVHQCLSSRLHVSRFVCGAAEQDRLLAVPVPHHREAGVRLGVCGPLDLRVVPRRAIVGADLDLRYA